MFRGIIRSLLMGTTLKALVLAYRDELMGQTGNNY